MGKASTEAKNRWNYENYKRLTVCLRVSDDADLIQFVEQNKDKYSITEIFRAGIEALREKSN